MQNSAYPLHGCVLEGTGPLDVVDVCVVKVDEAAVDVFVLVCVWRAVPLAAPVNESVALAEKEDEADEAEGDASFVPDRIIREAEEEDEADVVVLVEPELDMAYGWIGDLHSWLLIAVPTASYMTVGI